MSRIMVAGFVQLETIVKVSELPVPYQRFQSIPDMINTNIGGSGYNSAVALAWLGNDVDFMSMIGKELQKSEQYKKLMESSVNLSFDYVLPLLDDMPSSVILYHNGEKQVFEDVKDVRTVSYDYELFERQIQDKDLVLISSCNFCRPVIELAEKYHKPLAVNIRSLKKERIQQKEDFLKAADILHISGDELDKDPYECINELREKYNPEVVIIGVGDKGVILYTREDNSILEYNPVKTVEIVNTVGAGNAMYSAFLHYYLKIGDAKESIKNALLFASYKIGFMGTSNGFMTEEQIEQWKQLIWNR